MLLLSKRENKILGTEIADVHLQVPLPQLTSMIEVTYV